MLADLRTPADAASLISAGYAMFFGGLLMTGARLGDRFGHRRTILAGLLVFAAAAVIGATAASAAVLTAARCLQGAAAALSVPSALRLLTTITADGPPRRKAIAWWSAAGAAAGASGFVAGGVVTGLVGWRAVFWAYLPLSLALAAAISRTTPPDDGVDRSVRLSLASAAAFTATVMAFVVATTLLPEQSRTAAGAALLGVAVLLAGSFVVLDRRSAAPLLPGRVLRERPLREGAAGGLLNTAATSSAITLTTLYLQDARGYSPLTAGLMLLPFSLAVVGGSALAARALARWRPVPAVAWGLAAAISAAGAIVFVRRDRRMVVTARNRRHVHGPGSPGKLEKGTFLSGVRPGRPGRATAEHSAGHVGPAGPEETEYRGLLTISGNDPICSCELVLRSGSLTC